MVQLSFKLLATILFLSLFSCNKEVKGELSGSGVFCYPRECLKVVASAMRPSRTPEERRYYLGMRTLFVPVDTGGVEVRDYRLWVVTGADELDSMLKREPKLRSDGVKLYNQYDWMSRYIASRLAPKNTALEKQINRDYHAGIDNNTYSSGITAFNLVPWEYRVTGVTNFKITAMSTLFGLPAGSSLNDYFSIHDFAPRQIISYKSKTLIYGYEDEGKITSIRQWLSMSPTAPPSMAFRLNKIPKELPQDVTFVVSLTTTDNVTLRDTVQVKLR